MSSATMLLLLGLALGILSQTSTAKEEDRTCDKAGSCACGSGANERNWNEFPDEWAHRDSKHKIMGGVTAKKDSWPWFVQYWCGGTLVRASPLQNVASDIVLTAVHCLTGSRGSKQNAAQRKFIHLDLPMKIGRDKHYPLASVEGPTAWRSARGYFKNEYGHSLGGWTEEETQRCYKEQRKRGNPGWYYPNGLPRSCRHSDFAIMKLRRPFKFNKHVQPLCLVPRPMSFDHNDDCRVMGHGEDKSKRANTRFLQELRAKVKWDACARNTTKYPDLPKCAPNFWMIGAKTYFGNGSTIRKYRPTIGSGDSGSGLQCRKGNSGPWYYLGALAHFGHPCQYSDAVSWVDEIREEACRLSDLRCDKAYEYKNPAYGRCMEEVESGSGNAFQAGFAYDDHVNQGNSWYEAHTATRCYQVIYHDGFWPEKRHHNFTEAEKTCRKAGGKLATLANKQRYSWRWESLVDQALRTLKKKHSDQFLWVNLQQEENRTWTWPTNWEPYGKSDPFFHRLNNKHVQWAKNEPDNRVSFSSWAYSSGDDADTGALAVHVKSSDGRNLSGIADVHPGGHHLALCEFHQRLGPDGEDVEKANP